MNACILSIIRDCPQLREDLINSFKNRKEKSNDGTGENQSDNGKFSEKHNGNRESGKTNFRTDGRPCVLPNRKNMSAKGTRKGYAGRGRVCGRA